MTPIQIAKMMLFRLRQYLRLTPMHSVRRSLHRRGVNLKSTRALELFGGRGDKLVVEYAPYVGNLEIWEIDPSCEADLRSRFPYARIRITDSYTEIRKCPSKFDLVVADIWVSHIFDGYCEHFELFPHIFRILSPSAILILNVVPNTRSLSTEHGQRRCQFYQVEDPTEIPLKHMVKIYDSIAASHGFHIDWWFYKDRLFLYSFRQRWLKRRYGFLVLGLKSG